MPRNAPQGKQGRQVHAGEAEESGQGSEAVVGEGAAGMASEEDGDMAALRYAGIGARATPAAVLADMTVMASWLVRTGWHLASGGVTKPTVHLRRERRRSSGRSGCRGGATGDTADRAAGCCRRLGCRLAWRSRPRCIRRGSGVRQPCTDCMRGMSRSCWVRGGTGPSMQSCAGRSGDGQRAARGRPSGSPGPAASRCSTWVRWRRGRSASGCGISAGPAVSGSEG